MKMERTDGICESEETIQEPLAIGKALSFSTSDVAITLETDNGPSKEQIFQTNMFGVACEFDLHACPWPPTPGHPSLAPNTWQEIEIVIVTTCRPALSPPEQRRGAC